MTALVPRALRAGAAVTDRATAGTACLGVLVTIPDPVADRLAAWRERFVTPPLTGVPAHITLLPPTLVPADRLDAVERHLRRAAAGTARFDVHLRGSGTFLPVSPVTFVQVATGIGSCELLESRIRTGPLARPLQFPYHPHVTVAHNVEPAVLDRVDADLARFEARFEVATVDLYEAAPPGAGPSGAGAPGGADDGSTAGEPGEWSLRAVFPLA